MLGLTPDPLSAGVGMRVAVAGPYGHERVTAWQDGADAQRKNTAGGSRFVWPSTRAGRRPRPPVPNGRLRHMLIGDARVSQSGRLPVTGPALRNPSAHSGPSSAVPRRGGRCCKRSAPGLFFIGLLEMGVRGPQKVDPRTEHGGHARLADQAMTMWTWQ